MNSHQQSAAAEAMVYTSKSKAGKAREAEKAGLKIFKHNSCNKCSGTLFYSSNNNCVNCNKINSARYRSKNHALVEQKNKEWKQANKDKINALRKAKYREKNQGARRYSSKTKQLNVKQSIINNPNLTYKEIGDIHDVSEPSVRYTAKKFNISRGK